MTTDRRRSACRTCGGLRSHRPEMLIDAGTVPTGLLAKKWGLPFKNWAGDLPGGQGAASPYSEYRVRPAPGVGGAGVRRVVRDRKTGRMYYTWTHYGDTGNPAFVQVR